MNFENSKIRQLQRNEDIPYDLLLLADETTEAINKYINDSEIYILVNNEKIIAVYVLQDLRNNIVEIKNIAVDEEYQGHGIGRTLLLDAIRRAREKNFKTIIIGTANGGIKQLYLYQKVGFEIYDIKKNFISDNYPEPIYENGILLKHMIMLKKELK
ncbi:MAG: GNAT family N-acetyltransferase [Candidatus Lokiarchaeota archaeon]|nr:GNAT family N-acetyltransferase [Candidatus Lokiarchaeota archaeon]